MPANLSLAKASYMAKSEVNEWGNILGLLLP